MCNVIFEQRAQIKRLILPFLPGRRVGGAAEAAGVPSAGLRAQLGHGRARPPRPLPDAHAGPPGARGPGGQGAGRILKTFLSRHDPSTLDSLIDVRCLGVGNQLI